MRRVLGLALAPLMASCGLDGLLLTPRGFDATPPPRVVLVGETEGPALVTVLSPDGAVLVSVESTGQGEIELPLPVGAPGRALRVLARRGSRTTKTLVADAPVGQFTPLGRLDARTTALAQLALYEVLSEAGSSLASTPPTALAGLLRTLGEAPTPALEALVTFVQAALDAAPTDGSAPGLFDALGFEGSPEAFRAAGLADGAEAYRTLLVAAARDYGLTVRCDPSRLNVMFTVDASGRARDGNGAPQLIRQATKTDRLFVGFTADESSPVVDDSIPDKLVPNDAAYALTDDGQGGDEVAGDGVHTVVVPLPRGARLLYKYTNGAAGEGFTGTEEWPGNARILEVEDVLTGRPDGELDCVVVRRDAFGDEASNKNFVNLHARARAAGGAVGFGTDLGGVEVTPAPGGALLGGLDRLGLRSEPGLTPAGVPEARENGVCAPCPAPIVLDPADQAPPALLSAVRTAVDRVIVRFSEPIAAVDARDVGKFLVLDEAGRSVEVRAARSSGSDVLLELEPAHPTNPLRLRVRELRDVSTRQNVLAAAEVDVGPDVTAPRVLAVRSRSRLDVDGSARVEDPTVGELIDVVLDEVPESSAASDPARFLVDGLEVRAATLLTSAVAPTVRVVTAPQAKGRAYTLTVRGLRDIAGNAAEQSASFAGFALYRATFSVVPGLALVSADGAARGLPRGEALYLTGTPLTAARALDGRSLSITTLGGLRTDVTGYPAFELKPSGRSYTPPGAAAQPIYELDVLLPPGSWAWKPAHGVEGEFTRAPTTLEKVAKALATSADATGVRVDPATLRAANDVDYTGARLSLSGQDPARRGVLFKREVPDEVCEVRARDVACPLVVVGTWRDAVDGMTDYDDGLVALPLHRPELPDYAAPRLLDARARDSYTLLLSFDEALSSSQRLEVSVARAVDGVGLRAAVVPSTELPAHQVVVEVVGRLVDAEPYVVRYRGAADRASPPHVDRTARTVTVLAPASESPRLPLVDRAPPRVRSATVTDVTELVVRFDEALDPATVQASAFSAARVGSGEALAISAAELLPDRRSVRLTSARQPLFVDYRLTVSGVGDVADPANVLTSTTIAVRSFGERRPPTLLRARAVGPDQVLLRFDEPLDATSAAAAASYRLDGGAAVVSASFADDPARRGLAFSGRLAPRQRELVLLTTSVLDAGRTYTVSAPAVADLSGNLASGGATVVGVSQAPTVDVLLEVRVSDGVAVAGQIPARALSPAAVGESREGVFVLGARASADGVPAEGPGGAVNDTLGGFPREGQPLDGIEPRLHDDGTTGDRVAGDGIYSVLVPRVPLGTTLLWKAFAPYTTGYRDRSGDRAAAFADATPGPSAFSDGQEYPGNENGVIVLDEGATAGVVRIQAVFGDEVTYKKFSAGPAFVWAAGDVVAR